MVCCQWPGIPAISRSTSSSSHGTLFKLFNIKAIIIMRLICHEQTITTIWTWGHGMIKCKIRKTLVVSLLPLIWSFPSKMLLCWYFRTNSPLRNSRFYFNSTVVIYLKNDQWPKNNRSCKAVKHIFLPPVSLRQTWHKSLEWLHENKMNHTPKLKWTTTKSIIYLIKELPHAIWRSLARGPPGKHFNSHCGDAFIKITTTIPGLPELICYKQS